MGEKKLIIGVGSGRCGTHSLAALLDYQHSSKVTHEMRPLLPWDHSGNVLARCIQMLEGPADLCGDVAFFYLVYLPRILDFFPQAIVIGLKRDKAGTVASFRRRHQKAGLLRWTKNGTKDDWQKCFPFYDDVPAYNGKNGCELYWEEYYERLEVVRQQYPDRVFVFDTDKLNSPSEILDAVGIKKRKQLPRVFRESRT